MSIERLERTRIGIITPDDAVNDDEYWMYVGGDVTLLIDRYRTPERFAPISAEMVSSYSQLDLLADCAETLRITRPQAIAFFCNSCSFVGGVGSDLEICRRIQDTVGVPATTISTEQVEALRNLGIKRVAVGAPYSKEVTARFHSFLEQHDIEVVSSRSLGLSAEWEIGNAVESVWSDLATSVDHPDAEGIVLACSGIRTAKVTEFVEARLRKPLISAPGAGLWHALRLANYRRPIHDRGVLFEKYLF
jgi:maleate isomerase